MRNTINTINCICFILLCCSCNYQQKKQEEQRIRDSIAFAEKRSIEIADSIKAVMLQKQSLIAWGDAKFGMTLKEALKTKALEGSYVYEDELSLPYPKSQIANTKILISSFDISFKMDELYRIDFKTSLQTANYIDDLQGDADKISYQFSKKYGEPIYSLNREISIFDFNEGDEFYYKKWNIGDKSIYILFGEVDEGSEYYYRVAIFNVKYPSKEDTEEIKQQEKRIKEQIEKEKYQF